MEFRRSLKDSTRQRTGLLNVLESLLAEGWSRSATVFGAGQYVELTVLAYADWLARHERALPETDQEDCRGGYRLR